MIESITLHPASGRRDPDDRIPYTPTGVDGGQAVKYVWQRDALRFLSELSGQSVDLVVSSPPYFMGKEYDTSWSTKDFEKIHAQLLQQLVRVVKPGGSICWQVGHHVRNNILVPLDAVVYSVFSKSKE